MTAEARVVRAAPEYFGFDTNVRSPGRAWSIPLSPVISVSGEPFSRRAPRAEARAESFMDAVTGIDSVRDCSGSRERFRRRRVPNPWSSGRLRPHAGDRRSRRNVPTSGVLIALYEHPLLNAQSESSLLSQ